MSLGHDHGEAGCHVEVGHGAGVEYHSEVGNHGEVGHGVEHHYEVSDHGEIGHWVEVIMENLYMRIRDDSFTSFHRLR